MRKILPLFFVLFTALPSLFAKDGELPAPTAVVGKLYTDHLANKGPLIDRQSRESWEFLFGSDLRKALETDHWGFDPLVFAQDHEIKNLTVKEIDRDDKGGVLVLVGFENFGTPIRLIVSLNHTDHGYRIENIVDPVTGVDLISDLTAE